MFSFLLWELMGSYGGVNGELKELRELKKLKDNTVSEPYDFISI